MNVAWYGVVPTGNQASYALELLVQETADKFSEAVEPLTCHRYVDDIVSGAESPELREKQINQSMKVLARGGFKFKYVIRSGEEPPEGASADGESCKMLGYKWNPKEDYLSPGLGELNFNPKVRGAKAPIEAPVTTREEARDLIRKVTLTRQAVMARIAELFDPIGLLEPIKLQLKLHLVRLNGKSWKAALSPEKEEFWREKLVEFVDLPSIPVLRCVIPAGFGNQDIRLVCFADAAKDAGGAAIYAGVEISPGVYFSALFTAKLRLMKGTVPRNELSAIMLMTELAFVAKRALGERVKEVVYVSDSMIALSWCSSLEKKLHLFVQNRETTILRMVAWTLSLKDE